MEYALAKNTFCRSCGLHYEIGAAPKVQPSLVARDHRGDKAPEESKSDWLSGLFGAKKPQDVRCFDCDTIQHVVASARSTNCPKCGTYIDLQDIKINSPFSRNFRTHGHLHVGPKGICNSVRGECGSAKIEGELGGNLTCGGILDLRREGRMPGALKAHTLLIHKKSATEFVRPIKAVDVDIAGALKADIHAEGTVHLRKSGSLYGSVTAKSFVIERGAVFEGQVTISPPGKVGIRSMILSEAKPADAPSNQAPVQTTLDLPATEG